MLWTFFISSIALYNYIDNFPLIYETYYGRDLYTHISILSYIIIDEIT